MKSVIFAVFLLVNCCYAQISDSSLDNKVKQYTSERADVLETQSYVNELKYPLEANYYPFSEDQAVELGHGFLPYHLDRYKESPFTYDIVEIPDVGANKTTFEMTLVFNRTQLYKSLDWDIKLNASAFGFTADEFYHSVSNSTFDESSVYLVIKAFTEFPRLSLSNRKIKPEAQKLAKKDPNKFLEVYGSKIATMARRCAAVYVIVKLDNRFSEIKEDITNQSKLSFSGLVVSGSVESNLKKGFKKTENRSNLEVKVLSRGGTGFDRLSSLVENLTTSTDTDLAFGKLKDGIANYLKTIDAKNAAILGYFATDYSLLDTKLSKIPKDIYGVSKEKCLTVIVDKYNFVEKEIGQLNLLQQKKDPYYFLLTETEKASIPSYIEALNKYQQTLLELHKYLSDKSPKPIGDYDFNLVKIPIPPHIPFLDKQFTMDMKDNTIIIQGKFLQNVKVRSEPLDGNNGERFDLVNFSDIQTPTTNGNFTVTTSSAKTSITIKNEHFQSLLSGKGWEKYTKPEGAYIIIEVFDQGGRKLDFNIGRIRCLSEDNCVLAYINPEPIDQSKVFRYCYITCKKGTKVSYSNIFKANKFDLNQPGVITRLAKMFGVTEKDIKIEEFVTDQEAKTSIESAIKASTAEKLNYPVAKANCNVEKFCRYGIGNLCALNIKVDGDKYYKKFPCTTSTDDMFQNAIACCNDGTLDIFWDKEWGLDCP